MCSTDCSPWGTWPSIPRAAMGSLYGSSEARARIARTTEGALATLLAERTRSPKREASREASREGCWEGKLSSSALSTATAVGALAVVSRARSEQA
ncbi:MAG: hypothetical protein ACI8QS_003453, partial [Planctomycetota bacterium]